MNLNVETMLTIKYYYKDIVLKYLIFLFSMTSVKNKCDYLTSFILYPLTLN